MMQHQEFEYAGFWLRVVATIIDTVLVVLITSPMMLSVYGWDYFDGEKSRTIAGPAEILIGWVLPAIAVIVFWMKKQATPGKMALSLRILDATTGNKPSSGQFVGRYFGYLVSMLPLFLGLIWVAFDKRKQGWHDKLAGTVVVKAKNPVRFVQS
jgi:uncharacterized RDD family membrane protein YckC